MIVNNKIADFIADRCGRIRLYSSKTNKSREFKDIEVSLLVGNFVVKVPLTSFKKME